VKVGEIDSGWKYSVLSSAKKYTPHCYCTKFSISHPYQWNMCSIYIHHLHFQT